MIGPARVPRCTNDHSSHPGTQKDTTAPPTKSYILGVHWNRKKLGEVQVISVEMIRSYYSTCHPPSRSRTYPQDQTLALQPPTREAAMDLAHPTNSTSVRHIRHVFRPTSQEPVLHVYIASKNNANQRKLSSTIYPIGIKL